MRLPRARPFASSCSSSEPPDVVHDVAGEKDVPAHRRERDGQPLARAVVVYGAGVLPEIPVDRQQAETDGRKVLLHLERALGLPEAVLLDRDADVNAVLVVDARAEDEGGARSED